MVNVRFEVAEDSSILGCGIVLLGECSSVFGRIVLPLLSGLSNPRRMAA
jgi:hypothetical protein